MCYSTFSFKTNEQSHSLVPRPSALVYTEGPGMWLAISLPFRHEGLETQPLPSRHEGLETRPLPSQHEGLGMWLAISLSTWHINSQTAADANKISSLLDLTRNYQIQLWCIAIAHMLSMCSNDFITNLWRITIYPSCVSIVCAHNSYVSQRWSITCVYSLNTVLSYGCPIVSGSHQVTWVQLMKHPCLGFWCKINS